MTHRSRVVTLVAGLAALAAGLAIFGCGRGNAGGTDAPPPTPVKRTFFTISDEAIAHAGIEVAPVAEQTRTAQVEAPARAEQLVATREHEALSGPGQGAGLSAMKWFGSVQQLPQPAAGTAH